MLPYNIPHQAMLIVELRGLATLLKTVNLRRDLAQQATTRADTVEGALWDWGTVQSKRFGEVFAYEVDGWCKFCCVLVCKCSFFVVKDSEVLSSKMVS